MPENRKYDTVNPILANKLFIRRLSPSRQESIPDLPTDFLLARFLRQVRVLLRAVVIVLALLAAAGCAILDYSKGGGAQQRQAEIERLVNSNNYHKALICLAKIEPELDSEAYKAEYQRITLLMEGFATDVEQKAVDLAELDDLLGAVTIVDQALEKIPESEKLLALRDKLRQDRDSRAAENDRNILISEAEYLFYRLQYYGEKAKLENPSRKIRSQRKRVEKSLSALYPDLLECGRQAIELEQYGVAGRCLAMARNINDSELVSQLLARIKNSVADIEATGEDAAIIFLAATKKSKPAAELSLSVIELETKLKHEIANGQLLKAYHSLAKLEKIPGEQRQAETYREQLDNLRESHLTRLLEEGTELYRRGKISEARSKWQDILALDPENEIAREKIGRADKVLESIKDLQKTQQKIAGQ